MVDISKLPTPVNLVFDKYEPSTGAENRLPILILHGLYSCRAHWTSLPKELAEQSKRTVYIFDLRNMGESPWTEEIDFRAIVSDVVHFMNQNKIEKATMIGHSLGGMSIARLATLYPELAEKLVLLDIHPFKKYQEPNIVTAVTELLVKIIETLQGENITDVEAGRKRGVELLKEQPQFKDRENLDLFFVNLIMRDGQLDWQFNLKTLVKFIKNWKNASSEIVPKYDGPCLEIYGGKSEFYGEDDFESTRERLPNIKFECIKEADHSLQLTHPKEFLSIVLPFLES